MGRCSFQRKNNDSVDHGGVIRPRWATAALPLARPELAGLLLALASSDSVLPHQEVASNLTILMSMPCTWRSAGYAAHSTYRMITTIVKDGYRFNG